MGSIIPWALILVGQPQQQLSPSPLYKVANHLHSWEHNNNTISHVNIQFIQIYLQYIHSLVTIKFNIYIYNENYCDSLLKAGYIENLPISSWFIIVWDYSALHLYLPIAHWRYALGASGTPPWYYGCRTVWVTFWTFVWFWSMFTWMHDQARFEHHLIDLRG